MMAKPIRALELHYPIIQFFINPITSRLDKVRSERAFFQLPVQSANELSNDRGNNSLGSDHPA